MPCTSDCCSSSQPGPHTTARYRKVLWAALAINFGMFIIEIVMSARSGSVSLMSDSLDFLGDAGNYLISLLVLSMALHHRARASLLKGATMAAFGTWVLLTTLYQFWSGSLPNYHEMSIVGVLALLANVTAAALLYTFREGDSNMRGVWICSRTIIRQARQELRATADTSGR
ncbi:cation transporter [Lautropia mirabilis]|uniref:cation transporter n=1 Tax=Lautropia mirabilis TaxID=47671 RepID=UPI002349A2DD|nr:cation transporter [Lautropia mirabilis]MDC6093930.1 cation transporter [Lautropia mirabilis]